MRMEQRELMRYANCSTLKIATSLLPLMAIKMLSFIQLSKNMELFHIFNWLNLMLFTLMRLST